MLSLTTKFAAIDIGSNSTLLLIIEVGNDGVGRVVIDTKASTKLSSGTQYGAPIGEEALARQYAVLEKFASVLKQHQVANVVACGTQVFRAAANGQKIGEAIARRFGWGFQIISGEREAALSYRASCSGLTGIGAHRVVMDVGGGSSEVILGEGNDIRWSKSYPVGAVSLTERFGLHGQILSPAQLAPANDYLRGLFADIPSEQRLGGPEREVISVGGTAATLGAVKLGQKIFVPSAVHGVETSKDWIDSQITELGRMDLARRRELMPFDPDRAEIIVGGALIVSRLLEELGANRLRISNRGLRWGVIIDSFAQLQQAQIEQ